MFEVKIHQGRKLKKGVIKYFDRSNINFLKRWKNSIEKDEANLPTVRDSLELANLAIERWRIRRVKDFYANSMKEFEIYLNDNPRVEVSNLVVLECAWLDTKIACVCHFRRTWSNNLFIDYLAVHPKIILGGKKDMNYEVKGIGRVMMEFLCTVAKTNNCNYIWGETTQNSFNFYKHIFQFEEISDLLLIDKSKYIAFLDLIKSKFKE